MVRECSASPRPSEVRTVKALLQKLVIGESGQDLIEYALLVALIATVSFVALQGLGVSVSLFYQKVNTKMAAM